MPNTSYTTTAPLNIPPTPRSLDRLPYWAVWKRENGTKVPFTPVTGRRAKPNDSGTFSTQAKSERALASGKYEGLCVLVDESLGITMIDFDHVVPPEHAGDETHLPPDVRRIIRMANTYTTWSPSRTGIRMFCAATTGRDFENKNHGRKICIAEQYNAVRFATIMMNAPISNTPDSFNDNHDDLVAVLEALDFKPRAADQSERLQPPPSEWSGGGRTNEQVLETAFGAKNGDAIRRLYEGDTTGYPASQSDPGFSSEADFAFIGYLAGYVHSDNQLADLWRSSKLYRKKLDRNDYMKLTIDNIRKSQTWWWDPGYGERAPLPIVAPPLAVGATCPEQLQHAQDTIVLLTAQLQDAKQTITTRERVIVRERELRIAAEARAKRLGFERSSLMQVLRNPDLAAGPKLTHFATILDLGARIANGEAQTPAGFRLPAKRIADNTGQKVAAVRRHWNEAATCKLLTKTNVRETTEREGVDPETGEILTAAGLRDVTHIRVPEDNVTLLITPIASYRKAEPETRGGKREPRCADHPDAPTITTSITVCSECDVEIDRKITVHRPESSATVFAPDTSVAIPSFNTTVFAPDTKPASNPAPRKGSASNFEPEPPAETWAIYPTEPPTNTHGHDRWSA